MYVHYTNTASIMHNCSKKYAEACCNHRNKENKNIFLLDIMTIYRSSTLPLYPPS